MSLRGNTNTPCYILMNTNETLTKEESIYLEEYKKIEKLKLETWEKLNEIEKQIYTSQLDKDTLKNLKNNRIGLLNKISNYKSQLNKLEETQPLKNIVERYHERMRNKYREDTLAAWQEKVEEYKEKKERIRNEHMDKTSTSLKKIEEVQDNQEYQVNEVKKEQEQKINQPEIEEHKTVEKSNILFDKIHTKKLALIISLLLCVILYLSFLSFAFTEKTNRDTYICYTTKTGDCFHAITCSYVKNSSYETTVYEASKKYRKCSNCNPCYANNKTTITVYERNYFAPALISIPISVIIYFALINEKKESTEGDDS